ncbi:hypothetical protein [Kerstersia gyiorum]|uniref:Uncharacterized protein n=1 Tax=Kerstersia gyiorum TaxID=206506 RepID=A0A171KSI2_9BURK|nr:hypothetical protein [Kerstersia gyiorum]KKO71849.1 hypothetical protein AAV32_09785 [Kerstersia gyiorum]
MPAGLQTFHSDGSVKLDLITRLPKILGQITVPVGFVVATSGGGGLHFVQGLDMAGEVTVPEFSDGDPYWGVVPYVLDQTVVYNGTAYSAGINNTEFADPQITVSGTTLSWRYNWAYGELALSTGTAFFGGCNIFYGVA